MSDFVTQYLEESRQVIERLDASALERVAQGLARQRDGGGRLFILGVGGYLGQLAATIALVTSAERIVFGGGVMENGLLLPHIRDATRDVLAGYLPPREPDGCVENSVCVSALHGRAGLLGAMLLARRATEPSIAGDAEPDTRRESPATTRAVR